MGFSYRVEQMGIGFFHKYSFAELRRFVAGLIGWTGIEIRFAENQAPDVGTAFSAGA